ncbi:MAG: NAD(P)/FAD-dependent oxidoreductase [Clostridia bacterium]|nr:NAD(P)/FAD-dependent oxidoreductase [Clostridia bacterium]
MFDVCIIGAGVVGAMCARALSAYQLDICVVDRANDVCTGASRANSAIVHAGFDAKPGSLKARFNVQGSKMMEQVCAELGVKYVRNGSLVLGYSEEDQATLQDLYERGVQNGVEGLELLDRAGVLALEPNVTEEVTCALWAPTGAIVSPFGLCDAGLGNAMDNGAQFIRNFEVDHIKYEDGIYTLYAGEQTVQAKYVVNAAGLYSDKIAAMVGDESFSVHPRRGEYMVLDKACTPFLTSHTLFSTPTPKGKGILVTATTGGNVMLGPTAEELTDKEDNDTTAAGIASIRAQSARYIKGIPFGSVITSFTGLRAVGSTGDFIIHASAPRFITFGGIESPGLTSAPALGEYCVELLGKEGMLLEKKDNWNPIRKPSGWYRKLSDDQKNEVIAKDPAYGNMVCRCEEVTEGEIVYAIRTNPGARDVDGVKRRTRSGMGRCQGGFCSSIVIEILSRELNIPYERVTKSGGGSIINYGRTKGGKENA